MASNIELWQPTTLEIIPSTAKTIEEIAACAVQLGHKDRKQIIHAFEAEHYEIGMNYLWGKTITALKKELSSVGVGLIGEMLGKPNISENENIDDIITTKESIRLAEELGIITKTDALRLRHTYELITHFSQLEIAESDAEEFDQHEAISSLKACIKSVLGRPKVEVAKPFVEFRAALEDETFTEGDHRIDMLNSSPYFFKKLTISVLMNAARKNTGAALEHCLANVNIIIPSVWSGLRDTERWQVGHTYAAAYSDGKLATVSGLKSALMKVKGFDFVPENLRSDTFVKAADAILRAHDEINNFYNEPAPVKNLAKLGTTIPTPALPACICALLSVTLGNRYGTSWAAAEEATKILGMLTTDRWAYYLNNVLPSDTRILEKLSQQNPRSKWISIVDRFKLYDLPFKNTTIQQLIIKTQEKSEDKIQTISEKLLLEYYGKH